MMNRQHQQCNAPTIKLATRQTNTSTSNMTDHEQHQRCDETTTPLMQWTKYNTNTNNAINQHQH